MKPFLKLVAEDLYKRYNGDFENTCLVFPNRRAILYFNRYLSEIAQKPLWAPQYITISELMQQLSNMQIADNLLLLFDLHKVYCAERKLNESFDDFYFWGEMILNDFDDLDKYRVDANLLFQNLSALKNMNDQFAFLDEEQIKAIQYFWQSFTPGQDSTLQQSFIDVWSALLGVYHKFKAVLAAKNVAYEGMLYRHVADSITNNTLARLPWKNMAFAGFNALNKCEKELFNYCKVNSNSLFYWDYDNSYLQQPHEAGRFVRDNIADFPSALKPEEFNNLAQSKNIKIYSIPSNVGQTKVLPKVLEQFGAQQSFENTAVLLPDEGLLLPVLHAIPPQIKEVNISMGYPVGTSPVMSLVAALSELWMNPRVSKNQQIQFYYKPVLKVLKHPYMQMLQENTADIIERKVVERNMFWLSDNDLNNSELHSLIFRIVNSGNEYAERLLLIISEVYKRLMVPGENDDLHSTVDREILFSVYTSVKRLLSIILENNLEIETRTFQKILMKVLNGITVPFEGEPLAGLQIMGFLESRTLDFQNIIITSFNEGNLPKTGMPLSFIPYNLRKGFEMPTVEYRDAMYAYYFYRSIQRAENISLIYNTVGGGMGNAEISRFATQLKYESQHKLDFITQTFEVSSATEKEIVIAKTDELMQVMAKYVEGNEQNKYLSPSALSAYLQCGLKFYFQYVANLRQPDEPVEEIDAAMLGRLLHKALQIIYSPYINKKLQEAEIKAVMKNMALVESAIFKAISEEYLKDEKNPSIADLVGRNLIIFKMLQKYVLQVLNIDSQYAPLTITHIEAPINAGFEIRINGKPLKISLGGIADRVDHTAEGMRIVDYKTGKVTMAFENIDELFDVEAKNAKKEIFQTFVYACMSDALNTGRLPVVPAIYQVREIFDEKFDYHILADKVEVKDFTRFKAEFSEKLKLVLIDIFDTSKPFVQTQVREKCGYCPYAGICHRDM